MPYIYISLKIYLHDEWRHSFKQARLQSWDEMLKEKKPQLISFTFGFLSEAFFVLFEDAVFFARVVDVNINLNANYSSLPSQTFYFRNWFMCIVFVCDELSLAFFHHFPHVSKKKHKISVISVGPAPAHRHRLITKGNAQRKNFVCSLDNRFSSIHSLGIAQRGMDHQIIRKLNEKWLAVWVFFDSMRTTCTCT